MKRNGRVCNVVGQYLLNNGNVFAIALDESLQVRYECYI